MISNEEKIRVYESFLHQLQIHATITLSHEKVGKLINNACAWSYAHRVGNGECSDAEQQKNIRRAFNNLDRII